MYFTEAFREEVRAFLEDVLKSMAGEAGVEPPEVQESEFSVPPEGIGDLAYPMFRFAGPFRRAPAEIANAAAEMAQGRELENIGKIVASGPYVNFHADTGRMAEETLRAVLEMGNGYGSLPQRKERIIVEHTSANPTGPLHVGRARNPIIGDTIARILKRAGYDVTTEYYADDMGKQAAILTWAVENLKDVPEPEKEKEDHRLVGYYQAANRLMEESEATKKEIEDLLYRCEHGDEKAMERIKTVCERSLGGILETMKRLDISYDKITWESDFVLNGDVSQIIETLKKSEYAVEEDRAYYLDLTDFAGEFGIHGRSARVFFQRGDGTSLYQTRDMAYHLDKIKRCDIALNILGEDHKLQSKQVVIGLSVFLNEKPEARGNGWCFNEGCIEPIFYSFVTLPEGKMSTRKGRVVFIDDLLDEAKARALEEVKKRRSDISEDEMDEIAELVGTGAVRYNIIRVQADKKMVFRWEDALNFDGSSAPFIQYSHARARSILRKAGYSTPESADYRSLSEILTDEREIALIKELSRFPDVIRECAEGRKGHPLTSYAQAVASSFNQFYRYVPVLRAEGKEREARLMLVDATATVLASVLETLGIVAPERM